MAETVVAVGEEIARRLSGNPAAIAADAVAWIDKLTNDLEIPGLGSYGLGSENFLELIAKAKNASSMRANPVALSDAELTEILQTAL